MERQNRSLERGTTKMIVHLTMVLAIILALAVFTKLVLKSLAFPKLLKTEMTAETCPGPGETNSKPLISVIVPGKDESQKIEEATKQILASQNCRLELILVNDRSRDATLEIMERMAREDSRITALSVDQLPTGWTGKTHAMFRGAEAASGEILVFTDADAILSPYALCTALSLLLSKGLDLLSFLPGFTERGFIEDAIFPILAMGLLHHYPLADVNDHSKPAGLASGSFIMLTRKAYTEIGTWGRFRDQITEDIALAKAAKQQGMQLMVLRGSRLVQVEPFRNIAQVFRYWRRVYFGGLEGSVSRLLGTAVNHVALLATYILFAFAAIFLFAHATLVTKALFVVSGGAVVIISTLQILFIKHERGNWIYGLASPLGFLIGVFASLSALEAVIFHKAICWHGTCYR
jgi:cellulose synthase/poly-beta-1,6-N-acetylglucosamine synthase-like glycosyltransferase